MASHTVRIFVPNGFCVDPVVLSAGMSTLSSSVFASATEPRCSATSGDLIHGRRRNVERRRKYRPRRPAVIGRLPYKSSPRIAESAAVVVLKILDHSPWRAVSSSRGRVEDVARPFADRRRHGTWHGPNHRYRTNFHLNRCSGRTGGSSNNRTFPSNRSWPRRRHRRAE